MVSGGDNTYAPQRTTTICGGAFPEGVNNSPLRPPSQPALASQLSQIDDTTGSRLIESLTSANKQVVAGLTRKNLPKCHPDVFSGDATLFHPWKRAFKAMVKDMSVTDMSVGVLVRFRQEGVGVMCDIEQMFYSFYVNPEHRDYLRFLWFPDNDPKKALSIA